VETNRRLGNCKTLNYDVVYLRRDRSCYAPSSKEDPLQGLYLRYNEKRWGTRRKEYWETRSSGATWLSAGCVTNRNPNMANDKVELLRLGRRIQAERKLLGLTQNGFARDCGLNRTHFGGIERGERNLTFVVLCKICKRLRCDIANVTRGIPRSSYVRDP
jgi:DNA-binding XRE family transcriptional regulator